MDRDLLPLCLTRHFSDFSEGGAFYSERQGTIPGQQNSIEGGEREREQYGKPNYDHGLNGQGLIPNCLLLIMS